MAFGVGVYVEWTSQAAGVVKKKCGEIIAVVPPRVTPDIRGCGGWRDHETYVVRVREMHPNGRVKSSRLYWPRVSALRAL